MCTHRGGFWHHASTLVRKTLEKLENILITFCNLIIANLGKCLCLTLISFLLRYFSCDHSITMIAHAPLSPNHCVIRAL